MGDVQMACAVAVLPDGKVLAAGIVRDPRRGWTYDFVLQRCLSNGRLDRSFGTDGSTVTDFFGEDDRATQLAVPPDGKILLAGAARKGGKEYGALAGYTREGNPDRSFGIGGTSIFGFGTAGRSEFYSMAVQRDGKILVGGRADANSTLVRLWPGGRQFDYSFGDKGHIRVVPPPNYESCWTGLGLCPDDAVVTAHAFQQGKAYASTLARHKADGQPDLAFGNSGRRAIEVPGLARMAAMIIQPDGHVVIAGQPGWHSPDFTLARYTPVGRLDPHFGDGGRVTTDFKGTGDIQSLAIQSDGKIVAVGRVTREGGPWMIAVYRFQHDGRPDAPGGSARPPAAAEERH
jgi:uncharacterized delta-60 repeat protein